MNELPVDELKKAQGDLTEGRVEQARPILVDFIRRYPNSAEGWFLLSFVFPEQTRQVECLERALKIDPGLSRASLRLAQLRPPANPPTSTLSSAEMPKVSPFLHTDFSFLDENTFQVAQPAPRSWFDELQAVPPPVQPETAAVVSQVSAAAEPEEEAAAVETTPKPIDLPEAEELVDSELPPPLPEPSGLTRDQKIWIWVGVIIFLLLLISFGILYIGTLSVMPTPPPTLAVGE